MKLKTNDLAGQVETYILSFGPITFNTVIQFSLLKNENYDGIQLVDWFWCFNEVRQIKQLRTVYSPFLASRKQPAIILTLFHVSCLWWLLCNSRRWSQDGGGIGWREYEGRNPTNSSKDHLNAEQLPQNNFQILVEDPRHPERQPILFKRR